MTPTPNTRAFLWARLVFVTMLVVGVMNSRSASTADTGETRLDHPRATDVGTISAGGNHTCAIVADGSLWCWGRNDKGQLGLGDTTDRPSPTRVGSATNWRSVSSGSNSTTCAVNTLNEVYCWGYNFSGQVGVDKATTSVTSPTKVSALGTTVQSVSVGSFNACVVTTAATVKCWGSNSYGALGSGVTLGTSTHTPTSIANLSGTYSVVAAGGDGVCAQTTDNTVYCWGSDLWGQRGDGSTQTADGANPTRISTGAVVVGLVAGADTGSNCVVTQNSGVLCWGQNTDNFLNTTAGNMTSPIVTNVSPFYVSGSNVAARGFSIGSRFACMLRNADASIVCGGIDTLTGVGATGRVTNAPTGTGFLAMTTGTSHGCAIRSDRRLVCWGLNAYGQVGTGSTGTATAATAVTFGANSTQTVGAEPVAPSAPGSVTVTATYRALDVTWTTPTSSGTGWISDYEHRYSSNSGGSWSSWSSFGTTGNSGRISGLTSGTNYLVQIRAKTSDGVSDPTSSASAVAPTSGCNPLKDCTLGAVGPNGGTIVSDAGAGTTWSRFIEAAPVGWGNESSTDWQTASSRAANWRWGSSLPTKDELVAITAAYNANPQLLAGWGIADADQYWSLTDPWEEPTYDDDGNAVYPEDMAYAGSRLVSKTWWYGVRPVMYLDGPGPLAAPTVTATASELAISLTWTAPSVGTGGSITDYETRVSTNSGSSYGSWVPRGVVNSLELTGLTAGLSYRVQVRAVNFAGPGGSGQSSVVTMTSSLSPSSQTVNGTVNTAITASTAFTTTNFNGGVTYSVTSGTLPAGLALEPSTGVVSGTPTAASSAMVTITGTGATAGTASATVTFAITTAPPGSVGGVWAVDGVDGVVLEWLSPTTGEPATGYEYAVSTNGGQTFSAFAAVPTTLSTPWSSTQSKLTAKIATGLTRGTETIFQVRALNGTTPGPVFPDPTSGAVWTTWSPKATATMSDPCDPLNDCDPGDVGPGGGIIVYDHGSNATWGRYLEAAPAFWNGSSGDPGAMFGCAGTKINAAAGSTQQVIGVGPANSAAVMAACSTSGIAVRLADAYSSTVGGVTVDDWFLPSSGDLVEMNRYRASLGGWKHSSTDTSENYKNYASSTDFSTDYFYGIGGSRLKWFNVFVRPVRYVMGPAIPSAPGLIATKGDGSVSLVWGAPSNDGGNAISGYEFRYSSDGGVTWSAWTSLGLVTSHSLTSLTNGDSHKFEVRAVNRGGKGTTSATGTLVPGTTEVTGVEGTALSVSTLFDHANVSGGATYSVSSGTLPAGLALGATTGVITGTPTDDGTTSVTLAVTMGSSSANVVVQFTIAAAPPPPPLPSVPDSTPNNGATDPTNSIPGGSVPSQPETRPGASEGDSSTGDSSSASGSTTTSTTVRTALAPLLSPDKNATQLVSSESSSGASQIVDQVPSLITPERQEQLTAPAGDATMLVGGVLIEVTLVKATDELRNVPPNERSAEQVSELQDLADAMISQIRNILGSNEQVPISVVKTPTGAVIVGLVTDPLTGKAVRVPIEHVVLIRGGGLLLMVAGSNGTDPARVGPDGVLEVSKGGVVSVLAYGLTPGVTGEVVVMSTPRLISRFAVARDGGASAHAKLPTDLKVGSHTVVVTVGDEAASLGFRVVGKNQRSSIPVTGGIMSALLWLGTTLLGASALIAVVRRRHLSPSAGPETG